MIIPIQSGQSITPVFIPSPTTNTVQTYESDGSSTPIDQITNPWAWVILIIMLIIVFLPIGLLIKELIKFLENIE